jgi:hypothetical protein
MHTDRCGNTHRQKCCAKGSGKEVKIQQFMYRDTTNVQPEMYDYTSNNWSHWNSNEKLKEKFGKICHGNKHIHFGFYTGTKGCGCSSKVLLLMGKMLPETC